MSQVTLYIARHGKTMFNTIGRAQGWSDTPLTAEGQEGIRELGIGLKARGVRPDLAFSSDSGRTIQTMDIIRREMGCEQIPYQRDWRLREWCFGSLDGDYDGTLFNGVLPRVFKRPITELTRPELAQGIRAVDTASWAEDWDTLSSRIYKGFTDLAKATQASGGDTALVVSHGMTIGTFLWLIDEQIPVSLGLDNGSVSVVTYDEAGAFNIQAVGDMSYRQLGRKRIEEK
ncbi:histidine phosphatase family protein [Streptococcus sp. DD12]|uniref:histidine phosphatase family protein n=1 Tax=Streptococcus sp. DD12 TaxID=1777880 RepID=UPI00079654F9|nr:histidine phosphatase family protein [Streptococcus sp. DD12]KXT75728.1 Phosphoglycerate mutase family [Streptococcus sp. DD12]